MKRTVPIGMLIAVLVLLVAPAGAGVLEEKKKVDAFIEAEMKEPGAEKTASGLIFRTLREGTGANPVATDRVRVHYEGQFVDGTIFDSSYRRGEPTEFPLNAVIKCWMEGVQKIKVGGMAKLICPPGIAYGDRGMGKVVPPGSTLVFKVELLEILK